MRIDNNIDEVIGKIDKAQRSINAAGRRVVKRAQKAIAAAAREAVPVDEGDLKESIRETKIKAGRGFRFGEIYGSVVAGGPDAPYAVIVHEDLTAEHPRGGGPKYLERPGRQQEPTVIDDAEQEVRKSLARVGIGI